MSARRRRAGWLGRCGRGSLSSAGLRAGLPTKPYACTNTRHTLPIAASLSHALSRCAWCGQRRQRRNSCFVRWQRRQRDSVLWPVGRADARLPKRLKRASASESQSSFTVATQMLHLSLEDQRCTAGGLNRRWAIIMYVCACGVGREGARPRAGRTLARRASFCDWGALTADVLASGAAGQPKPRACASQLRGPQTGLRTRGCRWCVRWTLWQRYVNAIAVTVRTTGTRAGTA